MSFQGRIQDLKFEGAPVLGPPCGPQWVQGKALVGIQEAKTSEAPKF